MQRILGFFSFVQINVILAIAFFPVGAIMEVLK